MKPRVTYLAGTNYSGSTLLSLLATTHPEVVSIGEMGPAPLFEGPGFLCSCGERLVECPFYTAVAESMSASGEPLDLLDMRLRAASRDPRLDRLLSHHLGSTRLDFIRDRIMPLVPLASGAIARLRRGNKAFIEACLEVSGADVFFDTTKDPGRIPLLYGTEGLDVRIIHLVRDPRAVVASYRRKGSSATRQMAARWNRAHRRIARNLAHIPEERRLVLKYEDFCTSPDEHFRALCRFMGVEERDAPRNVKGTEQHVIGNAVRLPSDDRQDIRLDERWRQELPDEEQAITWSITASLAHQYGYRI